MKTLRPELKASQKALLSLVFLVFAGFGSAAFNPSAEARDLLKVTSRVAGDHRGDIYLVEIGDKRIVKMGKDKDIALTFGSGGSGRGQFNRPLGIATDKENNLFH